MATNQNDIDIELTDTELATLEAAIVVIEQFAARFPIVTAHDKKNHVKAPDGSGDWMDNMLTVADQNNDVLPRNYSPDPIRRDIKLDKVLAPLELRLQRALERLDGARFLARSDAFAALLGVRRKLKEAGVSGVDGNLNEGLRRFFGRESKDDATPTSGTP